jgi:ketosteroid isomerase-like protein
VSDAIQDVANAAATLVATFAAHDREAYFGCFTPDATFIFHTTPTVLTSRAAFEREWDRWEREDGFRVLACDSHDQHVTPLTDAAIFTHRVATRARVGNETVETDERETIVFQLQPDGRWLAVHEHLSPFPAQ